MNKLLASTCLLLGTIAGSSFASAADCGNVTIASMNWQSAEVISNLDKIILNEGYGCNAEITIGDSLVMLGQAGGPWSPKHAALYLWVEDVDATYARALQHGASSESAPEDKPYGHRNAGVLDPGGMTWWIGAPVK